MIFLYNVVAETLKKSPIEAAVAWLVRHDAELALPTVTIAKLPTNFRKSSRITAPDGMIAAIARVNGSQLETRNLAGFEATYFEFISPWDY